MTSEEEEGIFDDCCEIGYCCKFTIFLIWVFMLPFSITGLILCAIIMVLFAIIMVILYCCEIIYNCYLWVTKQLCCGGNGEPSAEPDDHRQDEPVQSVFPIPQQEPTTTINAHQEQFTRRKEQILANLIRKRVLSSKNKPPPPSAPPLPADLVQLGPVSFLRSFLEKRLKTTRHDNTEDEQDHEQDEEKAMYPIILPHEKALSSRYEKITKTDEEAQPPIPGSDGPPVAMKDDIYIESLRSLRENSSRISVNNDVEDSSLYSPKVCPICCEEYKKGDDIAWSKNENCYHAYHEDCIMEWLMDHDDCPMCREKYIDVPLIRLMERGESERGEESCTIS